MSLCGHEAGRGCCGPGHEAGSLRTSGYSQALRPPWARDQREVSMSLCGHEAGRGFHRPPIGKRLGEDYVVPSRARGRESVTSRSR
jgi:hypothetical protein